MRYKFLVILLLLSTCVATLGQEVDTGNVYYKVYEAATKAKKKESEGVRTLYKLSLEEHKDPLLSKMLIKSTMLRMIGTNSKYLRKYIILVDSKFIALEPMAFLGRTPLQVKCFKCKGEGILKSLCKDCFKGVCKNCKGKKRIGYRGLGGQYIVKNCITCKATGRCITCAATGIAKRGCHICTEKGSLFSARAVPLEYTKNLDYMINFLPKYAAGKNFLINAKMVGLAKTDQLKIEKEEAAKMAAKRRAEELEFYQAERKAAQKKREAKAYKGTTSVAGVSKRDANLGHVLLEFNQFFRNRERISKQSVYKEALAEYKDNNPTLVISVTASVGGVNKALKIQYLEAFYNFWKLRCSSNGLRGVVGMTVNYKKNVIASVESGEVKLK